MHSALVIVEKPNFGWPTEQPKERRWAELFTNLQAIIERNKGLIAQFTDGRLEIALEKEVNALADVLLAASKSRFHYRVLFFEKAPQWITGLGT